MPTSIINLQLTPLEQRALDAARRGKATRHEYIGIAGTPAVCDIVVIHENGAAAVLISERPDNLGTSVTNAIEHLATQIRKRHLQSVASDSIRWLERYPGNTNAMRTESLDRVMLQWDISADRYRSPTWHPVALDP